MEAFEFEYEGYAFRFDVDGQLEYWNEDRETWILWAVNDGSSKFGIRALLAALDEARAENARLTEQLRLRDELGSAMKAVKDENARLREALEEISRSDCNEIEFMKTELKAMTEIARAALAPKEKSDELCIDGMEPSLRFMTKEPNDATK